MEQPSARKLRFVLGAGLAAALALAAAQKFLPLPAAVFGRGELRVSVLGESSAVVLLFNPGAGTVNALSFPKLRQRRGVSAYQRASELAALTGAASPPQPGEVFYVSLAGEPDLEALWPYLNGWRSRPRLLAAAAAWAAGLRRRGDTNIGPFGLFVLFSEFARLGSSDFVVAEARREPEPEPEPEAAAAAAAVRVDVYNATGRRDLAARAAKYLRGRGFDVLTASAYGKIEKQSRVICYAADTAAAVKLREALGLGGREIHAQVSKKTLAEAAVVLGDDFKESVLKKAAEGPR